MDRIAYLIKYRLKFLFPIVEVISFAVVFLMYYKKRRRALSKALISGTFSDIDCTIRTLTSVDARVVSEFLQQSSKDHIKYFKPHEFDESSVRKVLTSTSFMTYGLFLEDRLIAYALLRLAPNGTAYIGRVVNSKFSGKGMGKYLLATYIGKRVVVGYGHVQLLVSSILRQLSLMSQLRAIK